jgi:hypothetical protein
MLLKPFLPVSRPSMSMSYGHNLDGCIGVAIDDGEREALERELASVVFAQWPRGRGVRHDFEALIHLADKVDGRTFASLRVPDQRRLEFLEGRRMDL